MVHTARSHSLMMTKPQAKENHDHLSIKFISLPVECPTSLFIDSGLPLRRNTQVIVYLPGTPLGCHQGGGHFWMMCQCRYIKNDDIDEDHCMMILMEPFL